MTYPQPRPPRYALKVRRDTAGLGLFAVDRIPAGRFVIEYWGDIVPDEVANEVAGRYLFELGNNRNILGARRDNLARYANHSCDPNCEARQVGHRIYLHSLRAIEPGEAITYDYGPAYWEALIGPAHCRCRKCDRRRNRS